MDALQISKNNSEKIKENAQLFNLLNNEVGKIIVGQESTINFCKLAILCEGHVLLEGLPGIAKTTLIKTLNKAMGLDFSRIQFTPDLLPSDVVGTLIYNQKEHTFETKKGPIFANLVLADEINRAPAKVQAALLEAMQEKQVTIGSHTYKLESPFLVLATQNPVEQEGTYRLPEAQVDRFLFKLHLGYPSKIEERQLLEQQFDFSKVHTVLHKKDILESQALMRSVYVDDKIKNYIIDLIFATRDPQSYKLNTIASYILYGASPRATLALYHASQAQAFLKGRHFVTPDDVKTVALPILRHRIVLTYEAQAELLTTDTLIKEILAEVPTP